jgi:hypothetical protein
MRGTTGAQGCQEQRNDNDDSCIHTGILQQPFVVLPTTLVTALAILFSQESLEELQPILPTDEHTGTLYMDQIIITRVS